MAKLDRDKPDSHKSQADTVENIEDTTIDTHEDVSAVKAFPEDSPEEGAVGGGALFGLGEDVAAVNAEENVAANDPRVEARDVVHTDKTREAAKRAGTARMTADEVKELKAAVPAAPAAPQPLNLVEYEEYAAEVAAQNAEAAREALKLTSDQRAQRVQELQRVAASAYEDNN